MNRDHSHSSFHVQCRRVSFWKMSMNMMPYVKYAFSIVNYVSYKFSILWSPPIHSNFPFVIGVAFSSTLFFITLWFNCSMGMTLSIYSVWWRCVQRWAWYSFYIFKGSFKTAFSQPNKNEIKYEKKKNPFIWCILIILIWS